MTVRERSSGNKVGWYHTLTRTALVLHATCPLFKTKPHTSDGKIGIGGCHLASSSHFLAWPYWICFTCFALLFLFLIFHIMYPKCSSSTLFSSQFLPFPLPQIYASSTSLQKTAGLPGTSIELSIIRCNKTRQKKKKTQDWTRQPGRRKGVSGTDKRVSDPCRLIRLLLQTVLSLQIIQIFCFSLLFL